MMFAVPGVLGGGVANIVPASMTRKSEAGSPPNVTRAPERKFDPVIVTGVPPSTGPEAGATAILDGAPSTITRLPLAIDAAAPRLTAILFGPSGAETETASSIVALVGAT